MIDPQKLKPLKSKLLNSDDGTMDVDVVSVVPEENAFDIITVGSIFIIFYMS